MTDIIKFVPPDEVGGKRTKPFDQALSKLPLTTGQHISDEGYVYDFTSIAQKFPPKNIIAIAEHFIDSFPDPFAPDIEPADFQRESEFNGWVSNSFSQPLTAIDLKNLAVIFELTDDLLVQGDYDYGVYKGEEIDLDMYRQIALDLAARQWIREEIIMRPVINPAVRREQVEQIYQDRQEEEEEILVAEEQSPFSSPIRLWERYGSELVADVTCFIDAQFSSMSYDEAIRRARDISDSEVERIKKEICAKFRLSDNSRDKMNVGDIVDLIEDDVFDEYRLFNMMAEKRLLRESLPYYTDDLKEPSKILAWKLLETGNDLYIGNL